MKKTIPFLLAIVFVLSSCMEQSKATSEPVSLVTSQETISSNTPESEEMASVDEVEEQEVDITKDYLPYFAEGVTVDFITFPLKSEGVPTSLTTEWFNDATLAVFDHSGQYAEMFCVAVNSEEVQHYNLDISCPVYSLKTFENKILVSAKEGFYLVDEMGKVEEVFIYMQEQAKYNLPNLNESEYVNYNSYPAVISDDLRYVAYYESEYGIYDADTNTNAGWYQTCFIDTQLETKEILIEGDFPANMDEFYVEFPMSFSQSNDFLFFEYIVYRGHDGSFGGGRINLATKQIESLSDMDLDWDRIIATDGSNEVFLSNLIPPTFPVSYITKYNFTDKSLISCEEVGVDQIVSNAGDSSYSLLNGRTHALLLNTSEDSYFTFYQQRDSFPFLRFRALSPNNKKIAGVTTESQKNCIVIVATLQGK